jgi:hypothetical protein
VNRLPAVRLRIPASQSIGVVTFNGDQQRLIENQARRSDPSLEAHFDRNQTNEPILVKNIEKVRGDERVVIIFSVTVSPKRTAASPPRYPRPTTKAATAPQERDLGTSRGSLKGDLTRCDLRRDPGACFVAFDAWQRQLQVVVHPSSNHYSL